MTTVTVVVPLRIRQWGGRKAIIAPDGAPLTSEEAQSGPVPTRGDPALVKALARAHRWRRMLEAGEHGTVRELARAEKVNETYISRALRLTLLSPDIVEAILDGRQPDGMTLPGLMDGVEVEWTDQSKSPGSAGHVIQATDAAARLWAFAENESMFSVGQKVWHRDGKRSGKVLECDGAGSTSNRTTAPNWTFWRVR